MAQIISFMDRKKSITDAERLKALVKGNIRHFTCNDCGADIEVINNEFPEDCPGCGRFIARWNKAEEHV